MFFIFAWKTDFKREKNNNSESHQGKWKIETHGIWLIEQEMMPSWNAGKNSQPDFLFLWCFFLSLMYLNISHNAASRRWKHSIQHVPSNFKEPKGGDADGIKRNVVRARETGKRLDLAERPCVNSLDVSLQPHTDNTFPSHRWRRELGNVSPLRSLETIFFLLLFWAFRRQEDVLSSGNEKQKSCACVCVWKWEREREIIVLLWQLTCDIQPGAAFSPYRNSFPSSFFKFKLVFNTN